jgi:hypothetical protein
MRTWEPDWWESVDPLPREGKGREVGGGVGGGEGREG